MTEIKFRGKAINSGEWVYSMTVSYGQIKRKDRNLYFELEPNQWVGVVNKTVTQFTGLLSSDGGCGLPIKEAYFGDIIRFYNTDGEERQAELIWYETELCIGFKRLDDGFVYTQRNFNDNGYFQPSKIQFEIIGNIYEPGQKNEAKPLLGSRCRERRKLNNEN